MKHLIRYFCVLSALLLYSSGVRADGGVTIVTQVGGVVSADGGQVTAEESDGICTLTATPASGYLLTADNITVVKTMTGNHAQSRHMVPAVAEPIVLVPVDVANPMGTTTYTFAMPEAPYDVEVTADFQVMFIPPFVNESDEIDGVPTYSMLFDVSDFTDSNGNPIDLSNVIVKNVLFTVPNNDSESTQGFSPATDDSPAGIILATSMTETDIDQASQEVAGTAAYADIFKGITLLLPAGTGRLCIIAQTDPGAVLYVKIGDNSPIAISNATFDDENWIDYECPEDTYVKIYLAPQDAGSRRKRAPFRDKRETATVKVTGISVNSSSMITAGSVSTQVKVYELLPSNIVNGGLGIVLATVCDQPVTDLGSNVFASVGDKDHVGYIDMSGSAIQGLGASTPSRSESSKAPASTARLGGLLKGFSDHTLVFLPEGNSDGGECNIIVNDVCNNLMLYDNYSFCTPRDFTASSLSLDRTFTTGRATTLMLPFDISTYDSNVLGTFHRFNKMEDNTVLFDEAEIGGIDANTPYVFIPKATELKVTSSIDVKTIDSNDPALSDIFFGTYTRQQAPARTFGLTPVASADSQVYGQFLPLAGDDILQPFSAYLRVDGETTSLSLVIGKDIVTSIEALNNDDIRSMALYTLGGQRVSHPRRGLYIANGRKIVFK